MNTYDVFLRGSDIELLTVYLRNKLTEIDLYLNSISVQTNISVRNEMILEARNLLANLISYIELPENMTQLESNCKTALRKLTTRINCEAELDVAARLIAGIPVSVDDSEMELTSSTIPLVTGLIYACEILNTVLSVSNVDISIISYAQIHEESILDTAIKGFGKAIKAIDITEAIIEMLHTADMVLEKSVSMREHPMLMDVTSINTKIVRYRKLREMDSMTLDELDNMTLGEVDIITINT